MADNMTEAQRRRTMSHIRSKNTKPEMMVRRYLFRHGFRYRLHVGTLPGCPDVVLSKHRLVIFVHGCFWHHHPGCRYAREPHSNQAYWLPKLKATEDRDTIHIRVLRNLGWRVIVVWECELKQDPETCCRRLLDEVVNGYEPFVNCRN